MEVDTRDLEAAPTSASDTAPLLALPTFMPTTPSPPANTSLTTPPAEQPMSRPGGRIAPDSWPGGRKVCYAWHGLNLGYGVYLAVVAGALGVGMAANGGASCESHLRAWASFEIVFCVLGVLNVVWKHRRVPQLVVDRNAQSDDVFIAASRFTLLDITGVYSGVLLNVAWIVWLVFGCIWTFEESNCADAAPILYQACSLVLKAHLVMVGTLVAVILCAASAMPVLYFVRPDLFNEPSRGATKSLIDRTTKRTTYRPPAQRSSRDNADNDEENKKEKEIENESEKVDEGESCAICLSEYVAGEEVRELGCGHMFHANCAEAWLQTNKTCAACRRPIDQAA